MSTPSTGMVIKLLTQKFRASSLNEVSPYIPPHMDSDSGNETEGSCSHDDLHQACLALSLIKESKPSSQSPHTLKRTYKHSNTQTKTSSIHSIVSTMDSQSKHSIRDRQTSCHGNVIRHGDGWKLYDDSGEDDEGSHSSEDELSSISRLRNVKALLFTGRDSSTPVKAKSKRKWSHESEAADAEIQELTMSEDGSVKCHPVRFSASPPSQAVVAKVRPHGTKSPPSQRPAVRNITPPSQSISTSQFLNLILQQGSQEVSPRKRHCLGTTIDTSRPCLDLEKMQQKSKTIRVVQHWDTPRISPNFDPSPFNFRSISGPFCPLTPVAGL